MQPKYHYNLHDKTINNIDEFIKYNAIVINYKLCVNGLSH